jgi:hypothetical protein
MRIRAIAAAIAALTLASCTQQTDGYTVSRRTQQDGTGSVDLVLADATKGEARDAIREYAADLEGAELYYLKVVTAEDADRYVCRARWYRDATAYDAHSDRTEQPTSWPHLAINCP